jgi:hypothetical protein
MAEQAKAILEVDKLDVVFNSIEIRECEQADITVTLPKPMTSGAKSDGADGECREHLVQNSTEPTSVMGRFLVRVEAFHPIDYDAKRQAHIAHLTTVLRCCAREQARGQ